MADLTKETWWQRVQARDKLTAPEVATTMEWIRYIGDLTLDRRELIRVVAALTHVARSAAYYFGDDGGPIAIQARKALALLDRPAQEVDRGK